MIQGFVAKVYGTFLRDIYTTLKTYSARIIMHKKRALTIPLYIYYSILTYKKENCNFQFETYIEEKQKES